MKKPEDLERLERIVKLYESPIVLVVSAVNGVTDILEDAVNNIGERNIKRILEKLLKIHMPFIEKSGVGVQGFVNRFEKLSDHFRAVKLLGKVPEFSRDYVISYGERLSSLIVTNFLGKMGHSFREILPEEMELITDGNFRTARVDFSLSKVGERLDTDGNYVVAGFYGVSRNGDVTVFGRGGGDYSTSAIANCINAEAVDLWKDSFGFMTCDPKSDVPANTIKRLDYGEAAEFSYFGARILHPMTVEPVVEKSVPIYIRYTGDVSDLTEELPKCRTLISDKSPEGFKGVAHTDNVAVLHFRGFGVGSIHGLVKRISEILLDKSVNIKSMYTSQTRINMIVSHEDLSKCVVLFEKNVLGNGIEVTFEDSLSMVAVIGRHSLGDKDFEFEITDAVSGITGVKTLMYGASQYALYFLVENMNLPKAVEAINGVLFSNREVIL